MRKYEITKQEQTFEEYLQANGYGYEITKQFISKTVYKIEKGGSVLEFEIYSEEKNPKIIIKNFERFFDIKVKNDLLNARLKELGLDD